METLRWTHTMFTVAGNCLRPNIHTPFQSILYNIYVNIGTFLLYGLFITEVLDIVFNVENQDEFAENFAITSSAFMILLKFIIISRRRVNIIILIKQLDKNFFLPVNKREMEIRLKFDRIIESITKAYTAVIVFFVTGIFFVSIVIDFKERKLVTRAWLPYDYSSPGLYLLTSVLEFAAAMFAALATIACENLYAALMLHICCQFEILEHRFNALNGQESYPANQCTFHHHQIYKYAEMVNDEFKGIVSCQFFISMSALCLSFYRIMYAEKLSMCVEILCYSICVLWQIFYYCFFGDLVKGKSIEFSVVIFGSDWPSWNESSKKVLLMVIRRSKVPIEFTSMQVVSLNLESFMSLVKTSYSAFNLMQTKG